MLGAPGYRLDQIPIEHHLVGHRVPERHVVVGHPGLLSVSIRHNPAGRIVVEKFQ
jgi:hypothetical protein